MFPEAACTLSASLAHRLHSPGHSDGPTTQAGPVPGWFCGDRPGEWACLCPPEAGSTILEAPSHREKETDSEPRPGPVAR